MFDMFNTYALARERKNHQYERERADHWMRRAEDAQKIADYRKETIDIMMVELKKLVPKLYCSFCGKSQHDVRKLFAGPTVFICNECVDLCGAIMKEEQKV